MIKAIYHSAIYEPLYNGLVFLLSLFPMWMNVGIAIIIFTIIIKLILFPFSKMAIVTQIRMKLLEPKINGIKEKYKKDKQEQSIQMMKLYKEHKLNPFSSILLILIQIPIIIALYRIFLFGGLPDINLEILYNFVSAPKAVSMSFFGADMSEKSYVFAFLAGLSQFFQAKFAIPAMPKTDGSKSIKNDLAKTMHLQMRYVLPVIIFFVSYHVTAAVALYWVTSNIFAIGQELVVRRKLEKDINLEHQNNAK